MDRDFVETKEGLLFCVVGCVHPRERAVAYLKYVPSADGKWGKKEHRYTRTMPHYTIASLSDNLNLLAKHYPQYLFHSRIWNIRMSAVPKKCIEKHYIPEKKLEQLFELKELDALQKKMLQLVCFFSEMASLPTDCFGITGSLLTDIHQTQFSDIDLIVYGCLNGWKIKAFLQTIKKDGTLTKSHRLVNEWNRWLTKYPLSLNEIKEIYSRRWNFGIFKDTSYSIHVVKTRGEVTEKYGNKIFLPIKMVEGKAKITDISNSLFLPCTYGVEFLKNMGNTVNITTIVSYNSFYGGIFNVGEHVLVRGKLEKVINRLSVNVSHRILIGSLESQGHEYIKPLL